MSVTQAQSPKPQAQSPRPEQSSRSKVRGSRFDFYRLITAFLLAVLLVWTLSAPKPGSRPNTAPLVTPGLDGSRSVTSAMTGAEVEQALFRYRGFVERNQGGITSIPERIEDILRYSPDSIRARRAIAGQLIASTSGNLNQAMVDTGFFSELTDQKIEGIEQAYLLQLSNQKSRARGTNGLAAMAVARSLSASGEERARLEREEALAGFQDALEAEQQTWQFTYNWSLTNLLIGNYAAAYEGMRGISSLAAQDDSFLGVGNKLTPFWMGLAALRAGDPGEAKIRFNEAINLQAPKGSNEELQKLYVQIKALGREGLADAQWANREPASAYKTYFDTLNLGDTDDTGLYGKWLSLGLQQRAYERLADDLATLESSGGFGKSARIHHDRARLLTFLGRVSEADGEYREALRLGGQDDASLHVSYGQFLESKGDHSGALTEAETAIRGLGKDPSSADLSEIARLAITSTSALADSYAAQQLLDANLLRAHAWGSQGQKDNVTRLANGIAQRAAELAPNEAGLLLLYGGFAAEVGGSFEAARDKYQAAWDKLKDLPGGALGRGAALAGLARATTQTGGSAAGLKVLSDNGYSVASPNKDITKDPDAPLVLQQAALLMDQGGKDTANTQRVAALIRNLQDARSLTGVGRPIWYNNGTLNPANAALESADASRAAGGSDDGLTILRYREAFALDPALAPAWNNLGVMYAQEGKQDLASSYLSLAGQVSPNYTWGQHNLATLEYKRGIGNFFNAEAAQGAAVKNAGPSSLAWGYNLRSDERGPLPAPSVPATDFLGRLPAALILILLLAHTLVGKDRRERTGLVPTKGVLGTVAGAVDVQAKKLVPNLMEPRNDMRSLLMVIIVPSVIGMVALAWSAGHGSLDVALVFLPVALLVSLLAFGANELAQYLAARMSRGATVHHIWPLGVLLGVLSIPFSFVYGWQVVTRLRPAASDLSDVVAATRHARTEEDLDMAYELQAEAAAELGQAAVPAKVLVPASEARLSSRLFSLGPAGRILFAGLAANLVVGLLFWLGYWLTGWPSLRLGMFASMLVLAFTSVSEPPADGWTLYRRNPRVWLVLFAFAALMVTLLAAGLT